MTHARPRAEEACAQMNTRRPAVPQVRDILILTASTGGGHDSVALALQQAIHTRAPEARVRILDPLAGGITTGALSPGRWYDATVEGAPWLWGLVYRVTNHAWAVRLGMAVGMVLWARRLRSIVETERPGLVVAVHPLCVRLAAGTLGAIAGAPPALCRHRPGHDSSLLGGGCRRGLLRRDAGCA